MRCKHPNKTFVGFTGENKSIYEWCPDCGYIKKAKIYENKGMKTKSIKIKGVENKNEV